MRQLHGLRIDIFELRLQGERVYQVWRQALEQLQAILFIGTRTA